MKQLNFITGLLFTMIMALFISNIFDLPLLAVGGLLLVLGLLPKPQGVNYMAIEREIWKNDIIETLFKNNQFAQMAVNADQYVLQGKIVHIPVAGAPSLVDKNRTNFPVTAVKRPDNEVVYAIDSFYSRPRHIEQIEKYELSFDKRSSVMGEDRENLIQTAMDSLLFRWAPAAANTKRTKGADGGATVSGATGDRKKFTKASFLEIKKEFDKNNIPSQDRVCLLTSEHYNDFLDSLSVGEQTDVGRVANMATGVVGQYLGITIYMRSTVVRYRTVGGILTPIDEQDPAFELSDKTGDFAASLFWQRNQVERAVGEVDVFDNPRQAEYYGDIYSMLLRMGGRIRRNSGVWAVVEDEAAG